MRTENLEHITLVMGGCRSGKSGHALDLANTMADRDKVYLATSVPTDPEMDQRVARHQAQRGPDWTTIEEPVMIHRAVSEAGKKASLILIDCLTLWTSNLLYQGRDETGILSACDDLGSAMASCPCPVILVSNEVGYGIVPENSLARQFRDLAGLVNQRAAKMAGKAVMTVAGIPVQIKPGMSLPGRSR